VQRGGGRERSASQLAPAGRTRSEEVIVNAERVLVVEDDADRRGTCVTILCHHRCEAVEALDGAEALRRAGEDAPDLVLMDARLGAEGYITKPCEPSKIVEEVRRSSGRPPT